MKRRADEIEAADEGYRHGNKERRTATPTHLEGEEEGGERSEDVEDESLEDDQKENQPKSSSEEVEIEGILLALETYPDDVTVKGAAKTLIKKM